MSSVDSREIELVRSKISIHIHTRNHANFVNVALFIRSISAQNIDSVERGQYLSCFLAFFVNSILFFFSPFNSNSLSHG